MLFEITSVFPDLTPEINSPSQISKVTQSIISL